jgi:crotonobetainyl-CoA:carnitine CoA-transferase CaiB-like acyl-CoA transferase
MLANVASNFLFSGREPGRYGNGHPNIVPYRTYPAADGELALAVGNDLQFRALAEALGQPEWTDDPRFATNPARVDNREVVDEAVGAVIATNDRAHWISLLDRAGIPAGAISTVSEALTSEQTRAREMVMEVDDPQWGLLQMLGFPLRFSATPAALHHPPPRLGADTSAILAGLGLAEEEIDELARLGVT